MKIGLLQCGPTPEELVPEHGDYPALYARMLDGHGFEHVHWRVFEGDFPDSPEAADGWLISGSRYGAYEDHAWIPPLEEFIRAVIAAGRPLVGICFGHQIIAQALGGKVEKFAGGWSVGATEYDFGGEVLTANAWHQDQVTVVPPGAQVVARSASCANAALLYPGRAYSVQPHPEFERGFVEALIRHKGPGVVPDALLDIATERLETPVDNARIAAQFAQFFRTGEIA